MTFQASDVAARWRVSEEVAQEFLEHFAALGLVQRDRAGRCWRVTERGYRLACGLSVLDGRAAA